MQVLSTIVSHVTRKTDILPLQKKKPKRQISCAVTDQHLFLFASQIEESYVS